MVLQTIWTAMVLSVTIYPIVAYIVVTRSKMGGFETTEILFMTLIAMSGGMLAAQFFMRSLLSDDRLFPKALDRLQGKSHDGSLLDEDLISTLLREHQTVGITLWALGEVPAVFGLMLTFLSGDFRYALGFAIFSLTTMKIFRPRYDFFVKQLKRFERHVEMRGYRV